MKVLFVGYHNPNFVTITEYAEKAIKELGYELIIYDDRKFIIPGRIRETVPFLQNADLFRINLRLVRLVQKEKPDVCIISGGTRILPETVEKIKTHRVSTALWTIDAPAPGFKNIEAAALAYDYVFCGGTEASELLKPLNHKNLYWLPFACDQDYHRPMDLTQEEQRYYQNDITFVGSFYPNRLKILEAISDFNLGIWGPGWQKAPLSSPLKKCIRKTNGVSPEEWLKIFSAAKIIIVIHYQDGKTPCYQASPKVYEALICGKCALVDAQKDVLALFKSGQELVVFKDIGELRSQLSFYLNHAEEREKIAAQARKLVLEKHTYRHRMKEMLEIICPK